MPLPQPVSYTHLDVYKRQAFAWQANLHRAFGRIQRRADQGFAQDQAGFPRLRTLRVFVHQLRGQRLVQRTPVDPDAHRLVVLQRELDQLRELGVLLAPEADVARIDAGCV